MRESLLTQIEKQRNYDKWNKINAKDPWVVQPSIWEKKHEFRANKWHEQTVAVEPERPSGEIIYTPHDCQRPGATTLPIGTIWECRTYTKKNPEGMSSVCRDQWIIEVSANGVALWTLYKRYF